MECNEVWPGRALSPAIIPQSSLEFSRWIFMSELNGNFLWLRDSKNPSYRHLLNLNQFEHYSIQFGWFSSIRFSWLRI